MTQQTQAGSGRIEKGVAAWMHAVSERPRRTLAALVVLCVLGVIGALQLGVNADSSRMLSPDLPDQQRAAEVTLAFPQLKRAIVIVVRSENSDAADLAVGALVTRLRDAPDTIRDVYAPVADPFMVSHGLLYRDAEQVDQALTRLSASSNLLAKLRSDQTVAGFIAALDDARALAERAELGPESLDRLYGEAASVIRAQLRGERRSFGWSSILADESEASRATRLITVAPELDLTRLSPAKPALQTIQSVIAELPEGLIADVEIGVTGEPALRADEMQSVVSTIGISLALSMVLVAVILWIGLQSVGRALLAFASLVVTLTLTTGFAGVAIGDLNLVSVAFIVLMVGLGIDFAIHILSHITELRRHGTPTSDICRLTGQRMGLALILSAATTSIAFLAFGTTDFAGMAQLGIIGGVGVLIACAVAMTLIPACIALRPGLAGDVSNRDRPSTTRTVRFHPVILPGLIITLAAAAIWPALSARFDADPMGLRDPQSLSVQTFGVLARSPETTPYRASILAASAGDAEQIAGRFANLEEIGAAIWLGDLVPEDQDEKLDLLDIAAPSIDFAINGEPADLIQREIDRDTQTTTFRDALIRQNATEATAGSTALAEALTIYLEQRNTTSDTLLREALYQAFPLLTDRLSAMLEADQIEVEALPAAIRDRFLNADGIYRVEILPERDLRDAAALHAFVKQVRDVSADAAGGPVQLAAAGRTIGWAMLQATLLAALATGLLAFWATRRLWDVIAILGPLCVAGILTAAASTLLDMPFNFANVIVLPLLIGIGVDSGIHIALREHRAPGAVFDTSTPRAVTFSALTTMAAFGTLALSDHRGTASMGILLAIAMCAAVACIMALTPTVIRWTRRHT